MPSRGPGTFGRFQLVQKLGAGAMGLVFEAVDPSTGRRCALKVLGASGAATPVQLERFAREGQALARIRHRHVVSVYEAGAIAGRGYVAMELVVGPTLARRIAEGASRAERLELLEQTARGVAAIHESGTIHRDLKPDNVLVDASGARVADLGLALFAGDEKITATGAFLGTPLYMAPEAARGERGAIGPWTDVYSLGAMLHEALVGEPPYTGELLQVLGGLLGSEPPPRPRARDRSVSPELDALCARALAKDGRERPTAAELAEALAAARRSEALPRRKRPAWPLGAAVVAAIGVVALVAASLLSRAPSVALTPPPPAAPTAGEPAARARADLAARHWSAAAKGAGAALDLDPRLADAFATRGRARARLGDRLGALADLARAIELDPRSATALLEHASLLAQLDHKDLDTAARELERARAVEGDTPRARVVRAIIAFARGDGATARAELDAALERDPGLVDAWTFRSVVRSVAGDDAGSREDTARAVALDPDDLDVRMNEGANAMRAGRTDDAIAAFGAAIARAPTFDPARQARALILGSLKRYDEALADLEESTRLHPDVGSTWALMGGIHSRRGALADALPCLDRAITLEPASASNFTERAKVKEGLGDTKGAAADLERAVGLEPHDFAALDHLGVLRGTLGEHPAAIDAFTRALALRPDSTVVLIERAFMRHRSGDRAGTIADLEKARDLGDSAAAQNLAKVLAEDPR